MSEPVEYEGNDPTKLQVGNNPKHKQLMAWRNGEHVIQYHHGSMGFGTSEHNYTMHEGENFVGTMGLDHLGRIQHIEIHPEKRRQGLATKLFNVATEVHQDIHTIPAPEHSDTRTSEGEAWARSKGAAPAEFHVEKGDYRANRWKTLRDPSTHEIKSHLNEFHAKMLENGMDEENMALARHHVEGATFHLDQAAKHEPGSSKYNEHMWEAHDHIDELGPIHEDNYGDMQEHEKLQEHIAKAY